jgi:hypothetical protein
MLGWMRQVNVVFCLAYPMDRSLLWRKARRGDLCLRFMPNQFKGKDQGSNLAKFDGGQLCGKAFGIVGMIKSTKIGLLKDFGPF